MTSSWLAPGAIAIVPLTLPLNWTAIVMVSSTTSLGSNVGQVPVWKIENFSPNCSQISSAKCGANGATMRASILIVSLDTVFGSVKPLTKIISCETAVLNLKFSMSSHTFLIDLWRSDWTSLLSFSSLILSTSLHILSKNFLTPFTHAVLRATSFSNGHINISYVLNASAPYSPITSSGLITLFHLLDIFLPSSANTNPTPYNFLNGSLVLTTPISYKNLCQKRP